jgi:hypothetical protein
MTTAATTRPLGARADQPVPPALLVALAAVAAVAAGASTRLGWEAPLVVGTGVLLVLAALRRPVAGGIVVVAVLPALCGVQRGLGLGAFKLSELLLLLVIAVHLPRRPGWSTRLRAEDLGLLAFVVLGAAFAAVHTLRGDSSTSSFLRIGFEPVLLYLTYWIASRLVTTRADLARVVRWLLVLSVVPSALAIGQAFDVPGVRQLLIDLTGGPSLPRPGAGGVGRATGPFPIWHSLGAYLVVVLVLGLALLLSGDRRVLPRWALLLVIAVDTAAVVLALTVTVIGWVVLAVLLVALRRGRVAQALLLLSAVAGVSMLLFAGPISERIAAQSTRSATSVNASSTTLLPQTLSYRISVWQRDYVPLLERAVPLGVSNELPASVVFKHAENQYITLVLRGGVLLLLGAVAALVLIGRELRRAARDPGLVGTTALAALSVLVLLPVAAMIWPYLTNAGFPQAFLALAGAVAGAHRARAQAAPLVVPGAGVVLRSSPHEQGPE